MRIRSGLRNVDRRRWLLAACAPAALSVLALTPAGALGGSAGQGGGDQAQGYVAVASASSARLTWLVPGQFAVEEVTDSGGPIAQSRLDAGRRESFASLPYPGGTAVAYQGLLNVATGVSSPYGYPFFVQAANPGQPEGELADPSGAYRLHAAAADGSTGALARFRPGATDAAVSGGEADTAIAVNGATVTATAESVSEAVSLGGGKLRIGSVRSRSVTTYTDGADAPKTETSLVVDGLAAGDTRFGVGPDGFVALGQPVPFPPKDASALLDQLLGPAGLTLRFVPAQTLTGGGSAAALEIVSKQPQPQLPSSNITLRLGGASSAVSLGESALPTPPADVPAAAPPAPAATGAPDGTNSSNGAGAPTAGPAAEGLAPGSGIRPQPLFGTAPGTTSAAGGSPFPAVPAEIGGAGEAAAGAGAVEAGIAGQQLALQPIVRPRKVGATRLLYGLLGGAAALMLLFGGAVTKRGGASPWLDA